MKTRTLTLVLLLVATSAVLAAVRGGERDSPSQPNPGPTAASGKVAEGGTAGTAAALGTSLAEWNRRNPMQGF